MPWTHVVRTAFLAACLLLVGSSPETGAQDRPGPPWRSRNDNPGPTQKGLILNTPAAFKGYTLFAPLGSRTTYLIDMKGNIAHSWPSKYEPGQAVYLLDDGSLLRSAREPDNRHFHGGGIGGRVERLAPDGAVLWSFVYADENHCLHHDIEPLPNGNILMIAWEKKTRQDVIAAGADPEQIIGDELWPDTVIEVAPRGPTGGNIVWQWHVWDHLVQNVDMNKPNYGIVADHPERIDVNHHQRGPRESPEEIARLQALGYIDGDRPETNRNDNRNRPPGPGPGGPDMRADWCHANAIAYNARLDQIALSVHNFNEIWIIDHTTTTSQAAGHTGGRYGKGGDVLYRWGNPQAYGAGDATDQQLFAQHDVRWIPDGSPGAGHLMAFNNGMHRPDGQYSSIVEIAPPIDQRGRYTRNRGEPYGPTKPTWEYTAENKEDFFSSHISGAERLPNGNTLICNGEQGRMFEVTADGKTVWEYVNPYSEHRRPNNGGVPPRRPNSDTRMRRPPGPPPFRSPGRPPGPGAPHDEGVFRATRLAPDHPGIQRLLAQKREPAGYP